MALLVLLLVVIPTVLGVVTLVYFVGRISGPTRESQDFTAHQQTADRLLAELDTLRSNNLISEPEYEERRKQVVNEFVSRTQSSSRS